jgi:3'-5' exoribonuclease
MKNQFVSSLSQSGEKVEDRFAVKFKKPPVSYKGKAGKWFELRLADRTGEITAKYWGRNDKETDALYGSIGRGDIVLVSGEVQEYPSGSRNFSISIDAAKGLLKKLGPGEYETEDFIPKTRRDVGAMLDETKSMLATVMNEHLRALAGSVLDDEKLMHDFTKAPAAMEYHQNYTGGLLEHTLNVMRLADRMCQIHPELDRDLVITGAFLHDVGKTIELEITGGVIDVSDPGMMIGHVTLGYEMVSKKIEAIPNFPKKLALKVRHVMLSHHGKLDQGAPKQPQLPEAIAVYYADECDAKVDLFLRLKREANTDDRWLWSKKIKGHVYLE